MKSVMILGAGSSVAEARHFRPIRSNEYPPLDGSFFERASILAERSTEIRRHKTLLRRAIRTDGGFVDPWTSSVPITMEQFFADVYYDVANDRSATAFAVYLALQDLYSSTIAHTTNWIVGRASSGILTKVLRLELERVGSDRLTLITFNQDLLIENALSRIGRLPEWCLHSLYGADELRPLSWDDSAAMQRITGGLFADHPASVCDHEPPVRLLKLHGSFNWATRRSERRPALGNLFPSRQKDVWVQNARRVQTGTQRMSTGPGAGRRNWYLWPLVVPPIYEKERIVGIDLVRDLWGQAGEALREAERVVILGYSAPESDVLARQLLRRSYARNDALSEIVVINPDMLVAAKLKASLGCTSVQVYDDAHTYLAARS